MRLSAQIRWHLLGNELHVLFSVPVVAVQAQPPCSSGSKPQATSGSSTLRLQEDVTHAYFPTWLSIRHMPRGLSGAILPGVVSWFGGLVH